MRLETPLEIAFYEYLEGVAEVPGPGDNPRIGEYLRTVGQAPEDETPWCSAFLNWCYASAGLVGTGSAAARSWLSWGRPVTIPSPGAVAILWRGSRTGWQGHVGFYVGEGGGTVILLGGNQGDRVSIAPYSKERLLGYRVP